MTAAPVFVAVTHVVVRRRGASRIVPRTIVSTGDDWRYLLEVGTLAIFEVESASKRDAADLVLAHLAGYAPHGVRRVYDRDGALRTQRRPRREGPDTQDR